MPKREKAPDGAPCWVDLMTSDPERSRAFYGELFGWTSSDPDEEFGGYVIFSKDGAAVGGGMTARPGMPDLWSVYLATDDAQKTTEAATANGAQVIVEPMVVGDAGTMAFISDPAGAAIGMWQAGANPGIELIAENGTPSWFELHTRDYEAAIAFYREVFRWDTKAVSDTPDLRYTTQVDGETMLAGVIDASNFLPEGMPSHWAVYFGVDDADAALAKIVELGGSIEAPAEDTPYGRLATATDPTGARFKLVAPNEEMPARDSST